MRKKYWFVSIFIILLLIIFGGLVWSHHNKQAQISSHTPLPLPKEYTVILTDKGFVPQHITIPKGVAVRWINESTKRGSVNSDKYPENRLYPEMNLGIFDKNTPLMHIFQTKGTYTYHDQFHPEFTGSVTVT